MLSVKKKFFHVWHPVQVHALFFPFRLIPLSSLQQRLQFSDMPTASLPRQQHKSTPHRHPSDQSDSFSTPSAVFPWERDDSKPAAKRRSPSSPKAPSTDISQAQSEQRVCGKEKDLGTQTDSEWGCMSNGHLGHMATTECCPIWKYKRTHAAQPNRIIKVAR